MPVKAVLLQCYTFSSSVLDSLNLERLNLEFWTTGDEIQALKRNQLSSFKQKTKM